jgi:site-specific DNA-methyltransferase (adenine-specific)
MDMLKILNQDCREALPNLPGDFFDSCVCDPPYELKMNTLKWDKTGIAFDVGVWEEVYRVMKPGAYLFAFAGDRLYHRLACAIEDAGFVIRGLWPWLYGSGFPKGLNLSKAFDKAAGVKPVDSKPASLGYAKNDNWNELKTQLVMPPPTTDLAKQWDGWNTAIKPAVEPICWAQKPREGKRIIDNVEKYGTGALNIDACRIPHDEPVKTTTRTSDKFQGTVLNSRKPGHYRTENEIASADPKGRWPTNVLLDQVAAGMLDAQVGRTVSKFFYCAKPSKAEKNLGLPTGEKNTHATVKPVDLMERLCCLVTPPGGVVLDPFCGSGTTGVAAVNQEFGFVGIELDPESAAIAEHRVNYALAERKEIPF